MSVLFSKLTWAVLLSLTVLTGLVGASLQFGEWAWLAAGSLVALLVSLTDLEGFGWREPRKPT